MNLLEKKSLQLLSIVLVAAFFVQLLLHAWLIGGRWDLNEQIAFGARLSEGFVGYSTGINDLFFPTSPYFPGVGYLSYLYDLLGVNSIYFNNKLMLLTAVAVGAIYFVVLRKLTLRLYPGISKTAVTIILLLLYATHFRIYMSYMSEFKPDTVLLIIAGLLFLMLEREKKPTLLNLLGIGAMLFIATFFKQSFFLCFGFVFLLVVLSKHFSIKEKLLIIISYGLVAILALWLIFLVPGLYYFCVTIMGQHPMVDTSTILMFLRTGITANIFFLLLFLLFIFKGFRRFSFFSPEGKYFIFAILWFLFNAVATAKIGGNTGNLEVAFIVFTPFVVYTVESLINRLYSKKLFYVATYAGVLIGIVYFASLTARFAKEVADKQTQDEAGIAFLSHAFKNKQAFVDGDTYIVAEMSGMKVLTEIETVGHFNNVPAYNFQNLKEAISIRKYDLFYLNHVPAESFSYFEDKEIWKVIEANYTTYENAGLPAHLKGKILVPKQAQ